MVLSARAAYGGFALVILIIELRDARLERAAFEREINKIYSRFSVSGELMSDEKWQQVIEEYEKTKIRVERGDEAVDEQRVLGCFGF